MYNLVLWEYYGKNKYISILCALTKNLLNQKTHTIAKYGKLVPIDFLMYGNLFSGSRKKDGKIHIFPTHGF